MRNPQQQITSEAFLISKALRGLRRCATRAAFVFLAAHLSITQSKTTFSHLFFFTQKPNCHD